MADASKKLSITYSSGLIPPPELMSTLAVFYDEVWLPYPCDIDIERVRECPLLKTIVDDNRNIRFFLPSQQYYSNWKNKWNSLFKNDILQVILPKEFNIKLSLDDHYNILYEHFLKINYILDIEREFFNNEIKLLEYEIKIRDDILSNDTFENKDTLENKDMSLINIENRQKELRLKWMEIIPLALHNADIHKPSHTELFFSDPSDTRTSQLALSLVQSLFHYKIPHLQELNSEQILEVREYLKDTKEGFTYYINQMTKEVERRIIEYDQPISLASLNTFQQDIEPYYEEFKRQLAAKKTGSWSRVLSAGGKFLQVDGTPWTLKFLGAVLEMCGVSLDEFTKAEQDNFLSNKAQAFHYLATLERYQP